MRARRSMELPPTQGSEALTASHPGPQPYHRCAVLISYHVSHLVKLAALREARIDFPSIFPRFSLEPKRYRSAI